MKKAVKNFGMILGTSLAVTMVGVMVESFKEKRTKYKVKAEDKRSSKAFFEFLKWNGLERKEFTHIRDAGYTPIYTYKSEVFQPQKARIPKGYVLHKMKHSSGCANYAYGLEWQKNSMFPVYRILFYLDDEKEWQNDDCGYDEEIEEEF